MGTFDAPASRGALPVLIEHASPPHPAITESAAVAIETTRMRPPPEMTTRGCQATGRPGSLAGGRVGWAT